MRYILFIMTGILATLLNFATLQASAMTRAPAPIDTSQTTDVKKVHACHTRRLRGHVHVSPGCRQVRKFSRPPKARPNPRLRRSHQRSAQQKRRQAQAQQKRRQTRAHQRRAHKKRLEKMRARQRRARQKRKN